MTPDDVTLSRQRALAFRVVFGTTLADKLATAGGDPAPEGALSPPTLPGRPPGLVPGTERAPFPRVDSLGDARARGHLLHFLANHELLAVELMALALLRFPDAPPSLRRGWAAALGEEQRHLAGYLARMDALGVRFGDLPLNRFLWDHLAFVPSVEALLAGMSLTFEQANLDWCVHFAALLRAADDPVSAALLDAVLADEIGHVRLGVTHLRRAAPTADLWDTWLRALPPPLTPARARGPRLVREARRQAGLDDAWSDRLEAFVHSRGRPPSVLAFDPGAEDRAVTGLAGPVARDLADDLVGVPLAWGVRDDVVQVGHLPHPHTSLLWRRAGLPPVDFQVVAHEHRVAEPPARVALGAKTAVPGLLAAVLEALDDPRCDASDLVGTVVRDLEGCAEAARRFSRLGLATRLKVPLETAGRGQRVLPVGPWPAAVEGWVRSRLAEGPLLAEPQLDPVLHLSFQLLVEPDRARLLGLTRFEVHGPPTGARRWTGSVVGSPWAGLGREAGGSAMLRFLHEGDGRWLDRVGTAVAHAVGTHLAGWPGPAGVDAYVHRTPAGLRLRPVSELNARRTFGHVALGLAAHLAGGRVGWLTVRPAAVGAPATPPGLALDARGRWLEGLLPLHDPQRTSRFHAWVGVAGDIAEARRRTAGVPPPP